MRNEMVTREPISLEEVQQEIDEVFTFNHPQTQENLTKCLRIQSLCKNLATLLANDVPQGKEQTMAINNVLAAALFACHGITRRQVVVVAVPGIQSPS